MMQAEQSDTFVLATHRTESVRDFAAMAFKAAGINVKFEGVGLDEVAIDIATGKTVLKINPKFYRPAEVELLIGDYSKAKNVLGWEPKASLEELSQKMVEADLKRIKSGVSF